MAPTVRSAISILINDRVKALAPNMSQAEIAAEIGIRPNLVSMHRNAKTPVPLVHVQAYAKVLGVDLALMLRLCMEQDKDYEGSPMQQIIQDHVMTENERKNVEALRSIFKWGEVPRLPKEALAAIAKAVGSTKAPTSRLSPKISS